MKLTLTLTDEQENTLKILAVKAGYDDVKTFAKDEFDNHVLGKKVGTPQIGAISTARGGRIKASSYGEVAV